MKERSKIVSNINVQLKKVKRNEASSEEAAKKFSKNRSLLGRIEIEYAAKLKEAEERKNRETSKLSRDIDNLREELNHIAQTKIGIFGFLKKTERGGSISETEPCTKVPQISRDELRC
jgi:hypothetical protein